MNNNDRLIEATVNQLLLEFANISKTDYNTPVGI